MTNEHEGHFAAKHPTDRMPDAATVREVETRASNREMPCAVAFKIAEDLDKTPAEIGLAIDSIEIRMVKCQLGLFGYTPQKRIVKPAREVTAPLETAIREALVKGRLPCAAAWRIARDLGIRKMAVSSACEALEIRISSCQLGAF
jgi:hypothetical protein